MIIALFLQGLALLLIYAYSRRTFWRGWRRQRVNPFGRYTEALFLRRKPLMALVVLMLLTILALSVYHITYWLHGAPAGTGDWLILTVGGFAMAVVVYSFVWIWNMFRNLRNQGLLNEFRLTRTTPQELLTPTFYRLTAVFAIYFTFLEFPVDQPPEFLILIPLAAAAGLAGAYAYVGFLFCAFNHGLGLFRGALTGLAAFGGIQVVLLPLFALREAYPQIGWPVELSIRALLYAGVGRLFFVSFLRTDPAVWAEGLSEDLGKKSRMYY